MSPIALESIVERAAEYNFPGEPLGLERADESVWRSALAAAETGRAQAIAAELEQLARRREKERDAEERREAMRHAEAVARGEEELTDEEQADVNQARIEALADHQRHEAERPQRVEALLERIAAALESRR